MDSLSAFMMPTFIPAAIRYIAAACILLLAAYLVYRALVRVVRDGSTARADVLTVVFGLSIAWYAVFLVISVNIEANLPINGRYLFPVYIAIIVVLFAALGRHRAGSTPRAADMAILALIGLVIVGHGFRSAAQASEAYREGIGYQGPKWHSSPTILAINQLAADAKIFSNAPDAINYLTGRHADLVPTRFERRTGESDPGNPYQAQLEALTAALLEGNAYVVFIDNVDWRFYLATEEDLRKDAGLQVTQTLSDGRIYGR
jgi:hypothetical protein